MMAQKTLHPSAGVDATIVENKHDQCLGKDLMELMEKGNKCVGIALSGAFPVKALRAAMECAKQRRPLAPLGRGLLIRLALG